MARRGEATTTGGATPAVVALTRAGVSFTPHHYDHDPAAESFGLEAAEELGVEPGRVFKTLVVDLAAGGGRGLGVTILPVDRQLDLKAAGAGFGVKRVALADPLVAERATGYVVGGISPLGRRTAAPSVLDDSALGHPSIFVSGGRRGFDLELAPTDLVTLLDARLAPISR
ncbi:aminoacyl-tRNA deacylase [Mobilicoccus massiliensis]|uniref:aminoacyl-tRNA deacylase n=1 Tax=Mobilicoccus massiliensis TaxID=1522310 RepID=UPI00059163D0|nr:aminoacyl-tRNA deacylase [Mobilicoccus massiliensis]